MDVNKGVAGKAICKSMKTKARRGERERQIVLATRIGAGYPTPGILEKEAASC